MNSPIIAAHSVTKTYQAGEIEHRDQDALSNEERKRQLTICVSRCTSEELILDL